MPAKICEWTNERQAFASFAGFTEKTQSAGHIRPLHWYVASRLVVEGGFDPDDITPRPPFRIHKRKSKGRVASLEFDPRSAGGGEAAILGGLKTKNVDVVVSKSGIGPVLAVSCKGTTGAYRNLTNRMEELIGDCTNLHIAYPALVLGYLHLMRANRRPGEVFDVIEPDANNRDDENGSSGKRRALKANDMAFGLDGEPVEGIKRFAIAVERLAGRSGLREDLTRYESIGIALVEADLERLGDVWDDFPRDAASLKLDGFFARLYSQYDERYVFGAPKLSSVTRRLEWATNSPALSEIDPDYVVRLGD